MTKTSRNEHMAHDVPTRVMLLTAKTPAQPNGRNPSTNPSGLGSPSLYVQLLKSMKQQPTPRITATTAKLIRTSTLFNHEVSCQCKWSHTNFSHWHTAYSHRFRKNIVSHAPDNGTEFGAYCARNGSLRNMRHHVPCERQQHHAEVARPKRNPETIVWK